MFGEKRKIKSEHGFSLVEALLAVSVLVFLLSAIAGALIYGRESFFVSGSRSRAIFLAEEGLEAVRNIRDDDFSNLTNGTYGLAVVSGEWRLSGSSDTTGVFTRQVNISSIDANRKLVNVDITWQQNPQRQGIISLPMHLTNWQVTSGPPPVPSCVAYCQGAGYSSGTCRAAPATCAIFGETYESGGNIYCIGGPAADTCCCLP